MCHHVLTPDWQALGRGLGGFDFSILQGFFSGGTLW